MKKVTLSILICLFWIKVQSQSETKIFPGANQQTPSRSQYFSWINNTNEGPTEKQTLTNLVFFEWLKKNYGLQLDIYAFDAGAIDGANFYGSMNSARFRSKFPQGFGPVAAKTKAMGTALGLWGGPDGFGNTPRQEKERSDMMVSLAQDYNFSLFKMDAVCGPLRPEKYDAFDRMMTEIRKHNPSLILLNHRLDLGKGTAHSTTYLLGGIETYIDVFTTNKVTAPHHRALAIARDGTPGLNRLTEDCGVCISSALDYWEDDLVLQAFNRNLILAPQIYGNPWLLRDDEFPLLARFFNIHKKYNNILVNGKVLPAEKYGPNALSRGDDATRLLTLRNLSWNPVKYTIALDTTIGLNKKESVWVMQYHPEEEIIGNFNYGSSLEVEVAPFRSLLLKVTTAPDKEKTITGAKYHVIKDIPGQPMEIELLGMPGEKAKIYLNGDYSKYQTATINNKDASSLLKGKAMEIHFQGTPLLEKFHRKLGDMQSIPVPADANSLYEATCYSADNNALEVRSLYRSGETKIPEVKAARDAFFNQPAFTERDIWDKNLFDGNEATTFSINLRYSEKQKPQSALRIDLGKVQHIDSLLITVPDAYVLSPWKLEEGIMASVSKDLKNWRSVTFLGATKMNIDLSDIDSIRYFKVKEAPLRISEIKGYTANKEVARDYWRSSNLFKNSFTANRAWSKDFFLNEIPKGSYLCIAINGEHGVEGAYAAVKIDGRLYGCPDRSPSYPANTFEYPVEEVTKNYTYYLPLTANMRGKKIEAFVIANDKNKVLSPEVWLSAYPVPFEKMNLKFIEKSKN
jgi:hypothetical protein